MTPDLSEVLDAWSEPRLIKTVTTTTVDFVESVQVAGRTRDVMDQPANKVRLQALSIDYSLRYLQFHSVDPIYIGEYVEVGGVDYKIIEAGDYQRYGFTDAIGEETRKPLLVVNV